MEKNLPISLILGRFDVQKTLSFRGLEHCFIFQFLGTMLTAWRCVLDVVLSFLKHLCSKMSWYETLEIQALILRIKQHEYEQSLY